MLTASIIASCGEPEGAGQDSSQAGKTAQPTPEAVLPASVPPAAGGNAAAVAGSGSAMPVATPQTPAVTEVAANAQQQTQDVDPSDIYYFACALCHKAGLNGAPKYGDHKAWAPRIQQGRDVLYQHALHGKGAMPPKGGKSALTDEQVKTAVDYMVKAAGGWPSG